MATLARGSRVCGIICLIFTAGCGNDPNSGLNIITVGGNGQGSSPGTGNVGTGSTSTSHGVGGRSSLPFTSTDAAARLAKSCGDGLDNNPDEACDDGNKDGGDGCDATCQVERDWTCPRTGGCTDNAKCGNGELSMSEACDDNNTEDGDGCSADCRAIEKGWECRAPGTDCFPICGDGLIMHRANGEPAEGCDDQNTDDDDGCYSNCVVAPGATCSGEPSQCSIAVCGNGGEPEAGESCDAGDKNGLFYGDGKGCSKTCTREPNCRNPDTGVTEACTTTCGDGNIDEGEECDDGNGVSNDGCSAECTKEDGFNCDGHPQSDISDCKQSEGKQCLVLPITYRDFDGQNAPNGHPDFFYLGATPKGGKKTICVPNASGREQGTSGDCPGNDSTDLCLGLVKDSLDANGKPVANVEREGGLTCPCQFTDWDKTPVTSGVTSGSGVTVHTCGSGSTQGVPVIEVDAVPIFQSADSFNEWYTDGPNRTTVVSTLELAQLDDNSEQYQFSSSDGRGVYDDIHDIFLRQGKSVTGQPVPADAVSTLESGFFPLDKLDATKSQSTVCNLWPYWTAAASCVGQQWDARGWSGSQATVPADPPGVMVSDVKGIKRDFYFTSEARYLFRYAGGETLSFFGDDDVWVFINGHLVLDLGAPHERLRGTVKLSTTGQTASATATVEAQDVKTGKFSKVGKAQSTNDLGLVAGKTYEIVVFHADVHPRESNYQLTLFGFSTTKSICTPDCGDGVRTMGEQCDLGREKNSDDAYEGCTTECKYGPYCGDGKTDGPEECDQEKENGATYGKDKCTSNCKWAAYCGDGKTDGKDGEECDTGGPSSVCDADCKAINIML